MANGWRWGLKLSNLLYWMFAPAPIKDFTLKHNVFKSKQSKDLKRSSLATTSVGGEML